MLNETSIMKSHITLSRYFEQIRRKVWGFWDYLHWPTDWGGRCCCLEKLRPLSVAKVSQIVSKWGSGGGGKGFNNVTTVFLSRTILLWSCVRPSIYCNCLLNVFVPFFSNICIFMHASVIALAQIYELVQNIISFSKAATSRKVI